MLLSTAICEAPFYKTNTTLSSRGFPAPGAIQRFTCRFTCKPIDNTISCRGELRIEDHQATDSNYFINGIKRLPPGKII